MKISDKPLAQKSQIVRKLFALSGTVLPLERRKEILQLCSEYNLILLEDDPYFYLQFEEKHLRPPSLFSLDTEGRVIRFDSFSKILSSGVRLGFVTGPKELIQRIVLHMQVNMNKKTKYFQFQLR